MRHFFNGIFLCCRPISAFMRAWISYSHSHLNPFDLIPYYHNIEYIRCNALFEPLLIIFCHKNVLFYFAFSVVCLVNLELKVRKIPISTCIFLFKAVFTFSCHFHKSLLDACVRNRRWEEIIRIMRGQKKGTFWNNNNNNQNDNNDQMNVTMLAHNGTIILCWFSSHCISRTVQA